MCSKTEESSEDQFIFKAGAIFPHISAIFNKTLRLLGTAIAPPQGMAIHIGTAGWSIPHQCKFEFPDPGTHLQRYGQRLNAVEINTSFYRDHKFESYVRWAASVPDHFRFSVKLSNYFTQEHELAVSGELLKDSLDRISGLGEKWGVLLVQLPPSLVFKDLVAERFMDRLRELYDGFVVWEPRHSSWAKPQALRLLKKYKIAKVFSDPDKCPVFEDVYEAAPIKYFRLHGTPEIYKSRYDMSFLSQIAPQLDARSSWCIFDNTTFGFAMENALELQQMLKKNLKVQVDLNPRFF